MGEQVCPHEFLIMPKDWKQRLYLTREALKCGACNAKVMVDWGKDATVAALHEQVRVLKEVARGLCLCSEMCDLGTLLVALETLKEE